MSYETSPILTRIKINKGWKNPAFPIKGLNYSYETLIWFKIYLLLKAYLALHEIKLLACEVRASENHIKTLYLSVTKQFEKKKIYKSKWKAKSSLRGLQSPLSKSQNSKARFLLYLDFKTLKKQSVFTFNNWQKKVLSKAWISKPRFSSWINLSTHIYQSRIHAKIFQQLARKSKTIFFKTTNINKFTIATIQNANFEQYVKHNFQKKLHALLTKTKKEIQFLKKGLFALAQYKRTTVSLKYLFHKLTNQYQQKIYFLKRLNILYQTSIFVLNGRKKKSSLNYFRSKIWQKKKQILFKSFWFNLKKEIRLIQQQPFFFRHQPKYFVLYRDILGGKRTNYSFFSSQNANSAHSLVKPSSLSIAKVQNLFWKFLSLQGSIFTKNGRKRYDIAFSPLIMKVLNFNIRLATKKIWHGNTPSLIKTRIFQNRTTPFESYLAKLIRFRQKTKTSSLVLKNRITSLQTFNNQYVEKKEKTRNNYRLPYKYNYKIQASLLSNFKLKYLIQDFIQQYFAIYVYVKILWPLAQIKNLTFYRLAFSKNKHRRGEQNLFNVQWFPTTISLKKRYVFFGYATKHVKLDSNIAKTHTNYIMQKMVANKFTPQTTAGSTLNYEKQTCPIPTVLHKIPKDKISKIVFSLWQEKKLKKNRYLLLKRKTIEEQTQKRLHWVARTPYMTNLLPTLTLFAKYLDPQPLAEDLAKILGETKKHSFTLRLIEKALNTVKLKRGVGYRIALIGRADGANKSRTIYLRKLSRNWSRQTFSKNVNFGSAQARATIGAFGVKIWVYF